MTSKTSPETVPAVLATTEPVKFPEYRGEQWTDLVSGAIVAPGADLVSGSLLIGVPFVITSATFRPGAYVNAATKAKGHYVSVEVVTGDATAFRNALRRGRITDQCPVEPGEELVFNEGGTGVYRQIVGAMEAFGWITLPEGQAEGASGESRLDTSPGQWGITETGTDAGVTVKIDNDGNAVVSVPLRIFCKRGLRQSEYQNDYTREGITRYLA